MKVTFRAGDLIATEKPFGFILYSQKRHERCDNCLLELSENPIKCQRCSYVSYCSDQCQNESIKYQWHNHECQLLSQRPLNNMARLIARIVIRLDQCNGKVSPATIGTHQRDWNCLMDHYENVIRNADAMRQFEPVLNDLELILGDKLPDIKQVISIYGKILINSFAVQDEYWNQIGQAIYLGISIFDHSCDPSANYRFVGKEIYVKAMRNINCDDIRDVRIAYIELLAPTEERQQLLAENYYFKCRCERCLDDYD